VSTKTLVDGRSDVDRTGQKPSHDWS
jgi:hypothetical protein